MLYTFLYVYKDFRARVSAVKREEADQQCERVYQQVTGKLIEDWSEVEVTELGGERHGK